MHSEQPTHAPNVDRRVAFAVGVFSLTILLLWWTAFYPGISTVDSQQAWDQANSWVFQDWHPVFHTWIIALLTRVWHSPGAVVLSQIVGMSLVLASLTRRLQRIGVRTVVAAVVPCLIVLSPQTGLTTMLMWKDVPFAISVLWMFCEVLDLATDPTRYLSSKGRCVRLGLAWAAVLLFRQNGTLVAGIVIVGVVLVFRSQWRRLLIAIGLALGSYAIVTGPVYSYLNVSPTPALFTYTTFVHDMAAFVNDHGDDMSTDEKAFLTNILPFDRWKAPSAANPTGLYYCRQATPLIFAKEFYPLTRIDDSGNLVPISTMPKVLTQNSQSVYLEQHSGEFMSLWKRFAVRWPGTLLGQRFCVGSLAWSPLHKTGLEVLQPLGKSTAGRTDLEVRPISTSLNRFFTNDIVRPWSSDDVRVLTWRAVIWVYLGLAAVLFATFRRRFSWRFGVVALPLFAPWFSVFTFTPGQSTRYMFPSYLVALACLGLPFMAKPIAPQPQVTDDEKTSVDDAPSVGPSS